VNATPVPLQDALDRHRRSVDTDFFDLSLRELARMAEEDEIRIAPEFQRQFRWNDELQSALIESFLLGLPVPPIFVATNPDGTWEVVDGLQRICTVLRYLGVDAAESPDLQFSDRRLVLTDLSTLVDFNATQFGDLPRPVRLMFERRYLRVQVLSDKSDLDVRFELFRRLNVGAVALTPQEIRGCVYRGPFNSLLAELGKAEDFQNVVKLQKQNQHNATFEEVILKFYAYLDNAANYDGRVTQFLNNYMHSRALDTDLNPDRDLFLSVVRHLTKATKGKPFLRSKTYVTPVNQLEAVLVGIGRVIRSGAEPAVPSDGWQDDEELVQASTKGTNTRSTFHARLNRAEQIFRS
jgi:hypothetical protein